MASPIIPRELAARHLSVSPALLVRYEARGLIRCVRDGEVEGYEPAEVRRAWAVVSLQREAGINLAGVEAVFSLRERLERVHGQLLRLASEMQAALEREVELEADAEDRPGR